jgi:hypothetical protein
MKVAEITEGATQIWGRSGTKTVRKYRCTSGPRKNRIVSKPSTCTAPKNVKKSLAFKKTRASRKNTMAYRAKITKKYNPASARLPRFNKPRRTSKRRRI